MIPEDCYYTEYHLWIRHEEDQTLLVGVTRPLLRKVGPLLSIDILDADDPIMPTIPFGQVEGLDDARQLYLPMEADILEVHEELKANLDKLANDPYGDGWLARIKLEDPQSQLIQLMTYHTYRDFVKESLGEDYLDE